jgi:UDP:flavonoid glycosyltransferase YjiC (YdhE family)
VDQLFWHANKDWVNRWRVHTLGLPPVPWTGPTRLSRQRQTPELFGFSPSFIPKPADWLPWQHVTGYWFWNAPGGWQPPDDLVQFLDAGPPPVYVGFGSVYELNPAALTRMVLQALDLTRQRAVVGAGWADLSAVQLPDHVFLLKSAPFGWLFPRMAAVVHHAGAGTTADALRAGVPSVCVTFWGEQRFWSARLAEAGVAPPPIPRKELTAQRLANRLRRALEDPAMRRRARELGERVRSENGVDRAVELFHYHLTAGRTV